MKVTNTIIVKGSDANALHVMGQIDRGKSRAYPYNTDRLLMINRDVVEAHRCLDRCAEVRLDLAGWHYRTTLIRNRLHQLAAALEF
jgi:hypothetical protein